MNHLSRKDLMTLEAYSEARPEFRKQVMAHKKNRIVPIGSNISLHFEDRLTMQYQIQEVLRVEKIFNAAEIDDELEAYNPLIPDGENFKATMMIEYPDEDERRIELARLIGIEDRTWVRVEGFDKVYAIADEDMERETEEKTSSVHFLRFQLDTAMVAAARGGAALAVGIDHENYAEALDPLPANYRDALTADLSAH